VHDRGPAATGAEVELDSFDAVRDEPVEGGAAGNLDAFSDGSLVVGA
jgi:hypothetical protein